MTRLNRRNILIGAGASLTVITLAATTDGFGLLRGFDELGAAPTFAVDGVAIRGYDAVAYFTEGRPVEGAAQFQTEHDGATWHFSSAANRDAFAADPGAYAPQYGGFCAWAVAAKGKLYSTQPANWTIVDGRLYLNYDDTIQYRWEQDIPAFIQEADTRWPELKRPA